MQRQTKTFHWTTDTPWFDIGKIAVLLATMAFDALGDAYNVLTFTGRGAADVRVTTVKSFNDVGYMDAYPVEDSRQATLEARSAGVLPF